MENLSFFDEQQTMENLNGVKDSKHLDVVKLNYESCESLTWQELFFGYNNLCAITYSSGIGFVCELLDRFEQAEIIFGCEDVMDYSMQSVMAYQCMERCIFSLQGIFFLMKRSICFQPRMVENA